MIDKVYYINLDKRPDRNAHFLKECAKARIPSNLIQRFSGLDGDTYPFDKDDLELFKDTSYAGYLCEKKVIGNQLSHCSILKDMVEKEYNHILVCQDDVVFKPNFMNYFKKVMENIPDDAEVVNIGFHKVTMFEDSIPWDLNSNDDFPELGDTKVNDYVCHLKHDINPSSLAYIVTLKGAIHLLDFFKKNGYFYETDHNFNRYLIDKNIYYGTTNVLCTGNPSLGSDIYSNF